MRETYRSLFRDMKRSISQDRSITLEKEAVALSSAFKENLFKGYKLLKQQHRTRIKAIMPPEAEFTEHYRQHYQPGNEEPIDVSGCELPPLATDDTLSRADFDAGLRCLNED